MQIETPKAHFRGNGEENMKRFAILAVAAAVAAVLALGGSIAAAQQTNPPSNHGDHSAMMMKAFNSFRSADVSFVDASGVTHTAHITPGVVQDVTASNVTVVPNGATTAIVYGITSNTFIFATPPKGSLQALSNGDKVLVVTVDGSPDAFAVTQFPPPSMFQFMNMFRMGMPSTSP